MTMMLRRGTVYVALCVAGLGALPIAGLGSALAQTPGGQPAGQKPDPSPFAPGDLKKPIFDTAKPTYNVGDTQRKTDSTVVAEVEGRTITLGTVADLIKTLPPADQRQSFPLLFAQIRQRLIVQQALVIQAHNTGVDEDPAVVRKLAEISSQTLADAYLRHVVLPQITEQDLLDRYNRDIAGKPGPEEVHLRLIMLPTRDAAQTVIAQLGTGADFGTLAKQLSKDATASSGGDLGWVQRHAVNPEIGAAAFSLPVRQITPYPVESLGVWFVLQVEERRQSPTPSFAAARAELTEALVRERVPAAMKQAMAGLAVRLYDISGKENMGGEEGSTGND